MTITLKTSVERELRLFVYGTLKQGQRNHRRFCAGATNIQRATLWGRLHHLDQGYPGLEIPPEHIMAQGSHDPLADVGLQTSSQPQELTRPVGDWDLVEGEIITFANPRHELPAIDRLEAFYPGNESEYYRVLVTARLENALTTVWTYRMPEISAGTRLTNGVWQHTG